MYAMILVTAVLRSDCGPFSVSTEFVMESITSTVIIPLPIEKIFDGGLISLTLAH